MPKNNYYWIFSILHPEDYPLQAADIELLRKNMLKLMEMSEEED